MSLTALRDIPGVFGSFLLTADGLLAQRDMPGVYPDAAFADIGRRLEAIAETSSAVVRGYYELLAKFNGYWFFSRRTPNGTLNIVAEEHVNFPALRMAANVAIRHLTATPLAPMPTETADPLATSHAPVAAPVATPLEATPTPIPEHRPKRIWRGQVVE